MTRMGAEVLFDDNKCTVSRDGTTITVGHIVSNKLYMVNTEECANLAANTTPSLEEWHNRFGHLNYNYIDRLAQGGLGSGMKYAKGKVDKDCEDCAKGTMHRVPFPKKSEKKTSQQLELIYSQCDVCSPMKVDSMGGSKYLLTFTDDHERYATVYFLKSEVRSLFLLQRVWWKTWWKMKPVYVYKPSEVITVGSMCSENLTIFVFTKEFRVSSATLILQSRMVYQRDSIGH